MQYIIAWLLCISGTVMNALGGNLDWHWLAISDVNVTIWLAIAYLIGERRKTTTVNIIRLKDAA